MAETMMGARSNRQSVQFFDVDLFRNKLENYMRKQDHEMCEAVNTKKRKLGDRWTDFEKEEMELAEDSRDDLVFHFNKRQRYYPIDDDELDMEEVSPLALPSPVSVPADMSASSHPWPFFNYQNQSHPEEEEDPMSLSMRRQLTGYSEVSPSSMQTSFDQDDSWMSPCPPLSRGSLSYASPMPDTPNNGLDTDSEQFQADLERCSALHSFEDPQEYLDLDVDAMAPYEKKLFAGLAPERYEKAQLIKKAFRQSERLLDQFAKENRAITEGDDQMQMDDGEYDQVFGELMHV